MYELLCSVYVFCLQLGDPVIFQENVTAFPAMVDLSVDKVNIKFCLQKTCILGIVPITVVRPALPTAVHDQSQYCYGS